MILIQLQIKNDILLPMGLGRRIFTLTICESSDARFYKNIIKVNFNFFLIIK